MQFSFTVCNGKLIRICNKRVYNTVEYEKLQVMHLDNQHALEYTFRWSAGLGYTFATGYRNCYLFTMQNFRDRGKDPEVALILDRAQFEITQW